ncbi:hypothetical protein [Mycoplasma sp. P36-A1]|uniref:hypothetical protein n=1 Tax=Mycoplasma sp. P36-A1 TaxID=3252900 RepID=UPI003C2C8CAA
MTIIHIIVCLIVIILLYLNMKSMTASLKQKNYFMQYHLEENEFIYKTAMSYKMKLLKINRISFLVSIVVAIIICIFSKYYLILLSYVILFLGGNLFINQYMITKYGEQLKSMNTLDSNQDEKFSKYGLLYNDDNTNSLWHKYLNNRYALNKNYTNIKQMIVVFVFSILIFVTIAVTSDFKIGFFNPDRHVQISTETNEPVESTTQPLNSKLKYEITKNYVVLSYDDKVHKVKKTDISKITKLDKLPVITSNIDGYQNSGINVGNFNLQAYAKSTLVLDRNHPPYIMITKNDKTAVFINYTDDDFFNKLKEK